MLSKPKYEEKKIKIKITNLAHKLKLLYLINQNNLK
jgi:hypothetical protein